jgi:hypothetical protein
MKDEAESKRPAQSKDLLEKIKSLRIEKACLSAEIETIHDRLRELEIKLSAYVDAASMVFGETQYQALMKALGGEVHRYASKHYAGLIEVGKKLGDEEAEENTKRLSENWARLLGSMSNHVEFGYSDLETLMTLMSFNISKAGLRSQMKAYVDSGLVDRVGERGKFVVTELGKKIVEAKLAKPDQDSHNGSDESAGSSMRTTRAFSPDIFD